MADDRRVRYTKLVLRESLIALLKQKPIARISITAICAGADINRATYYAHYTDQYDQLKQIEGEFLEGITAELRGFTATGDEASLFQMTERVLIHVAENADLCRVLLGGNGSIDFQERITRLLGASIIGAWKRESAVDDNAAGDLFGFVTAGCIGVLRKWLFDDGDRRTPQELAELLVRLCNSGVKGFQNPVHAETEPERREKGEIGEY